MELDFSTHDHKLSPVNIDPARQRGNQEVEYMLYCTTKHSTREKKILCPQNNSSDQGLSCPLNPVLSSRDATVYSYRTEEAELHEEFRAGVGNFSFLGAAIRLQIPKVPRVAGVRWYMLKNADNVLSPPHNDSEASEVRDLAFVPQNTPNDDSKPENSGSGSAAGAVKDSRVPDRVSDAPADQNSGSTRIPDSEFDTVLIDEADLRTVQNLRLYVENGYCWIADYGEIEPSGREPQTQTQTQRSKTLHQYLMRDCRPSGDLAVIVDHINGDTLDCRRSNLRWASHKLNSNNKVVNRDFLKETVERASEILNKEGTQLAWEPTQRSHPFIGFDHKRKKWLAKPFIQYDLGSHSELLDAIKVVESWIGEHAREDLSGMTAYFPVTQALGAKRPRLR